MRPETSQLVSISDLLFIHVRCLEMPLSAIVTGNQLYCCNVDASGTVTVAAVNDF